MLLQKQLPEGVEVMSVLSFIFVWRMVPETKGKTLEEMEKLWTK